MEESGAVTGTDPDHRFIIDPIDGTTNFMHSLPLFGISVALERKGEIVAAITYNPITDEMFTAEKGAGAFLNNKRLRVASRKDIHEALLGCGIPHRGREGHVENRTEIALLQAKAIGIRRLGSSRLNSLSRRAALTDLGARLNPDLAAGILLIREAVASPAIAMAKQARCKPETSSRRTPTAAAHQKELAAARKSPAQA
jgi:myo-inositol-1(or 4)-monophosphatase